MSNPSQSTPHDDQRHTRNLRPKKERTIEPLSSSVPSPTYGIPNYGVPSAGEDILEELRRKTAALANEMAAENNSKSKSKETTVAAEHRSEYPSHDNVDEKHDKPVEELHIPDLTASKEQGTESVSASLPKQTDTANPAVTLVREKLSKIYASEPNAKAEAREVEHLKTHRSKHQQFMYSLTTSGKSLADIQTEWHNYYVGLPDDQKHEVWQEFYEAQRPTHNTHNAHKPDHKHHENRKDIKSHHGRNADHAPARSSANHLHTSMSYQQSSSDQRTVSEIKSQLLDKISAGGKLTAVHHVKSLLFGLGMSALVLLLITFIFFNEAYIAPFISPNQSVSATPIIGAQDGPVGPESKIIIPKINLEVPVVYGLKTIEENDIQNALEEGVVHYATTPNPGEQGNSVIVGHSSNNILNKGKYKFAFVLLKRLEAEDTFFVHKDGVRYTYKVYKKEIVGPDTISVLGTQERANTITLITCDPPGTSVNRLIITAEQISPDPSGNKASSAITSPPAERQKLPSNAPSLWSRIWPF